MFTLQKKGEMERAQYEGQFLPSRSLWIRVEGAVAPPAPQSRRPWTNVTGYYLRTSVPKVIRRINMDS